MLQKRHLEQASEIETAVIHAFALIAASDGEAHDAERARFANWLSHGDLDDDQCEAIIAKYDDLCTRLLSGDDSARANARAAVRWAAGNEVHMELVLAAGHAAIVADERIDGREEVTIREVAELLGLDPEVV